MALENRKFKIVFLIDGSIVSRQNKADELDKTINLIRACVVKLLLHFATLVKDESRQLQWGFKFYNVQSQRYVFRNIFRDMDSKHIEEFENELEHWMEDNYCHDTPTAAQTTSNKKKALRSHNQYFGCDRSDLLEKELKTIIHDFQWQGPDISSPVKIKRRKTLSQSTTGEKLNVVFLISDCPHSRQEISLFATCNHDVTDKQFLSEFMPKNVFEQFYINSEIRLFWIDTNVLDSMVIH